MPSFVVPAKNHSLVTACGYLHQLCHVCQSLSKQRQYCPPLLPVKLAHVSLPLFLCQFAGRLWGMTIGSAPFFSTPARWSRGMISTCTSLPLPTTSLLLLFSSRSLICFSLAVSPATHFRSSSPQMPIFLWDCLSVSLVSIPIPLPPLLSLSLSLSLSHSLSV